MELKIKEEVGRNTNLEQRERKMKNTQKKKISRSCHQLTKVESEKCRVTATIDVIVTLCRKRVGKRVCNVLGAVSAVTQRADDNFEIFFFSAYFSSSFLFEFYVLVLRMDCECLARFKVAFTTLSTAVLAKEKCFAKVAG